jgi:outer membrane protein assembly factor BamB
MIRRGRRKLDHGTVLSFPQTERSMRPATLFAILVICCLAFQTRADWPHFRGPGFDNHASPKGLDLSLDNLEQRVKWRKKIGLGYTVVSVADGRAYTAGWTDGVATLLCFEPETGDEVWTFDYQTLRYNIVPEQPETNEGGPVVTPTIYDGKVYHTTRDGRIFCLDAKTGKLVWQHTFADLFDVPQPRWGFSAAPVIIDGILYMDVGKIVAMRADTAEIVWQTKDFVQSYSSPTPFTYKGTDYLAAFPLDGLVVVERATGKVVAEHPWANNPPCHAASPVVFDGNKIFFSMGFNKGGAVVRFTGDGVEMVWEGTQLATTIATSLYHEGHLYGFDQKVLRCVDAKTGDVKWSQRGLGQGSLMAVGDTMLIMSEGGELMAAPMTPDAFKPTDKTRLIFETKVWSCPTIANGLLYARGARGVLVCVDLREKP